MIYLLLDTSYVIFYRYYALLQWWKMAKSDEELGNPNENQEFIEKFEKTFLDSINNIKKKLKIHKEKICVIAARDCPRTEIWRNKFFSSYKEHRVQDDTFMGGPFFKRVYNDGLLEKAGVNFTLKHNTLEADDVIAITKKFIEVNTKNKASIYIITNDQDYLQLINENTFIYNLKFKELNSTKKSFKDPIKDLLCKIILGDKSDNIPPIFSKCGIKTVEKYLTNNELLQTDLDKYNVRDKFNFNKKIIDFNEIPSYLSNAFLENNKNILHDILLYFNNNV
tara:strand:+ start:2223 stop:3062 length:840 start_codon:yes stop_codon:yes gene_type:complete